MLDLENFIQLLEEAFPLNEELLSIDEKIVSKKALKRKRRKAKKLAAQKAQQAKEQDVQQDSQEDNQEDSQEIKKQELIVYDPNAYAEEKVTDYSEAFKNFRELYYQIFDKYNKMWQEANQIWEHAGKQKACPPEAHKLFEQCLQGLQQELESLMNGKYVELAEQMHEQELEYIQMQFTAMDKNLQKSKQLIEALDPEQFLADDKEQQAQISQDLTPLLPDNQKQDDKKLPAQKNKKVNDLLTFEKWQKSKQSVDAVWTRVMENEKELPNTNWAQFILKNNPVTWFGADLWKHIMSPIAKDMIKTFMYANPLTAMIFDGDFGKFGIGNSLAKIGNSIKKLKQLRQEKAKQKREKSFYNHRGIPKDINKLKLNELKQEFYGNQLFVDWVNVSYNHPEVDVSDKVNIRDYVKNIKKGFKEEDRQKVVSNFTKLISKLNEVGDYMKWDDKKSFEAAKKEALTDLSKEDTMNKVKDKREKDREKNKKNKNKTYTDIADIPKDEWDNMSSEQQQYYRDKQKLRDERMKQESYINISKLEKLLEEAEG